MTLLPLPLVALIGSPLSPKEVTRHLLDYDPCFGRHYAKSAKECKKCVAPVVVEGQLFLLHELCAARSRGATTPSQLRALTSRDVLARLEAGQGVEELFREVLGDGDPTILGTAARQLLASRFSYLRNQQDLPLPPLPPLKELVSCS